MRKVSKKQAARLREYTRLATIYLAQFRFCQVKSDYCTGLATEIHHSKGRIGDNLTDTSTFVAICRACHNYIEETAEGIKWGRENGFVKTRI